jgi:hypothetical protein
MRRILGTVLAAVAVAALAGCGGSSKPKKRAPIGPSFGETFATTKESAVRSVVLRYATGRRELVSAEAARLEALVLAPAPSSTGTGGPAPVQPGPPLAQPPPPPGRPPPPPGQGGPPPSSDLTGRPLGPGTGAPPSGLPGPIPNTGVVPGSQPLQPGQTPPVPSPVPVAPPPGGTAIAPSGPGPKLPPGMTPASLLQLLGKVKMELALWNSLISELDKGRAAKCYVVKEWKAGSEGAERTTSHLAVALIGAYAGLAEGDLSFELQWRRLVRRPAYPGDAPRADWELGDSRPTTATGENKPE